MKKINNKGFTTVEVLVCFVVVSVVMMSLYETISAFNIKKTAESYRSRVYEFKNSVTNVIQEDIIKRGLSSAKISTEFDVCGEACDPSDAEEKKGTKYILEMSFKDGTYKTLIVFKRYVRTNYRIDGKTTGDDIFYIQYGTEDDMIQYDLPNLGETKGYYSGTTFYVQNNDGNCYDQAVPSPAHEVTCQVTKDFQINNVNISITNEKDPDIESHVLNIYIGFYHADLGTKYAINISSPINYTNGDISSVSFPTGSDKNSRTSIYME